jgi:hypothetical protein
LDRVWKERKEETIGFLKQIVELIKDSERRKDASRRRRAEKFCAATNLKPKNMRKISENSIFQCHEVATIYVK